MYSVPQVRGFLAAATLSLFVFTLDHAAYAVFSHPLLTAQQSYTLQAPGASVHLSWPARPGAAQYRLQIAHDVTFTDIVADRVINGTAYDVIDLPAGRYFWRTAAQLGRHREYSAPVAVVVPARTSVIKPNETKKEPAEKPIKVTETVAKPASSKPAAPPPAKAPLDSIVIQGGWHAATGETQHPIRAHLRHPGLLDIVGINDSGVTYALDAITGRLLWSAPLPENNRGRLPLGTSYEPLVIQSADNLDSVIVPLGSSVRRLDGQTGGELWRIDLTAFAGSGVVWNDNRAAAIFIVDTTGRILFIINARDGSVLSKVELPDRVVGAPVVCAYQNSLAVIFAYENGRVEIRDRLARVVRTGETGSRNTTSPVFMTSSQTSLILAGTRTGVVTLDVNTLRPVGRINLSVEDLCEMLSVADLERDGNPEVIILTNRGKVIAARASDGRILWQSGLIEGARSLAFADVNHDGVIDVLVPDRHRFVVAVSGKDGSVLLSQERPTASGDGFGGVDGRSIITIPLNAATFVVASETASKGLRAVEVRKAQ